MRCGLEGLLLDGGHLLLLSGCTPAFIVTEVRLLEAALGAIELEEVSLVGETSLLATLGGLRRLNKALHGELRVEVLRVHVRHLVIGEVLPHEWHRNHHGHVVRHGPRVGVVHVLCIK